MSDEPHKPTEAELAGEAPSDASPEAPDAPEASASAEGVTEAQTPADASSLPDAAHHEHDAPEHDPHHDDYHHDHPNRVRLDTTCGEIVIQLLPDAAPTTVDHFMGLVHNGFFDGLTFHRVVPGFIVQAGCPRGDGTGDCGYSVAAELNDTPHERGTVSMARRPQDRDSASSQFFICLDRDNCAHLDGQYTVFGRVVRGMDAVDQMVDSPLAAPELGQPENPAQIIHCFEDWDDHHGDYDHDYHHGHDAEAPSDTHDTHDTHDAEESAETDQ